MAKNRIQYLELAIDFFGALPEDVKMRESAKIGHDPVKLLQTTITKYADIIELKVE